MSAISKKVVIWILIVSFILWGLVFTACSNTSAKVTEQLKIGNKYLQEGKYEEAILAFQKAIEIEPKNIDARIGLSETYIALGKKETAQDVLREATIVNPKEAKLYIKLAGIYIEQGRIDDALKILEQGNQETGNDEIVKMINELKNRKDSLSNKQPENNDSSSIQIERVVSGVTLTNATSEEYKQQSGRNPAKTNLKGMMRLDIDRSKIMPENIRSKIKYFHWDRHANTPIQVEEIFSRPILNNLLIDVDKESSILSTNLAEGSFYFSFLCLDSEKKVIGYYINQEPVIIKSE